MDAMEACSRMRFVQKQHLRKNSHCQAGCAAQGGRRLCNTILIPVPQGGHQEVYPRALSTAFGCNVDEKLGRSMDATSLEPFAARRPQTLTQPAEHLQPDRDRANSRHTHTHTLSTLKDLSKSIYGSIAADTLRIPAHFPRHPGGKPLDSG